MSAKASRQGNERCCKATATCQGGKLFLRATVSFA
jgi:hypothetical protein